MFWEEEPENDVVEASERVLDLAFTLRSRMLPVDHLHALNRALSPLLPELNEGLVGLHEIHLAASQNGWERPDPALGQHLVPSRRTRMRLRVPVELADSVRRRLEGVTLDLDGYELTLGEAREKRLFSHSTLYARHMRMAAGEAEDENRFLARLAETLETRGIQVKKALCGRTTEIATPEGPLITRSLMLADLSPADSLRLQEEGLDDPRHLGCGLFLPMKGIQTPKEA